MVRYQAIPPDRDNMTDTNDAAVPGAFAAEQEPEMQPTPASDPDPNPDPYPGWTYPTRMCRICREDVVPNVTMYPPGLPMKYQRPVVEYRNDDEYGRLIRPCKCRGGMRYIHELCLQRSRTEGVRPGSLWKCPTCGHQFNFKRLSVQRWLGNRLFSGFLTIQVMIIIMFLLGFVADPIINLYVDPYDTIVGNEPYWSEVDVVTRTNTVSGWSLHFTKGLISMGLVGFLKTAFLNPFNFLNIRGTGFVSTRRNGSATTGRDRAVNVSWIAVAIGITSAFYFFYKWVQTIIKHTLQRIGNHVVDTSLPGDDDDLKPPADWKASTPAQQPAASETKSPPEQQKHESQPHSEEKAPPISTTAPPDSDELGESVAADARESTEEADASSATSSLGLDKGISSALEDANEQGWSFVGIPRQR